MWLRKYLDTSNNRPLWANIANVLIENSIADSNKIDDKLAVNMFLQDWKPCLIHRSKLPPDLKRMVSVAKLYGVSLEALALPEKVKRNLPIWYHLCSDKLPNGLTRRKSTKCLKKSHEAMKVGDLIKLMERLDQNNLRDAHQDLQDCQCAPCEKDRTEGCENPNACIRTAEQIINKLYPKFKSSMQPLNDDGLSLSPNKRNKNRGAMKEEKGIITFNPSIQIEDDPSKCFRIFTDPKAKCKTQANRG